MTPDVSSEGQKQWEGKRAPLLSQRLPHSRDPKEPVFYALCLCAVDPRTAFTDRRAGHLC